MFALRTFKAGEPVVRYMGETITVREGKRREEEQLTVRCGCVVLTCGFDWIACFVVFQRCNIVS